MLKYVRASVQLEKGVRVILCYMVSDIQHRGVLYMTSEHIWPWSKAKLRQTRARCGPQLARTKDNTMAKAFCMVEMVSAYTDAAEWLTDKRFHMSAEVPTLGTAELAAAFASGSRTRALSAAVAQRFLSGIAEEKCKMKNSFPPKPQTFRWTISQ